MPVQPRFEGREYRLEPNELIRRLSTNCPSVTQLDFRHSCVYEGSRIDRQIYALSGNTRVSKVKVDLGRFEGDKKSFRSLANWLGSRGSKCELYLFASIPHEPDHIRALLKNRISVLASSAPNLNVKELFIDRTMADPTTFTDVISLLSRNTQMKLVAPTNDIQTVMSQVHRIDELDTFDLEAFEADAIPPSACEALLSHQNIRKLHFWIWSEQELESIVDCLNRQPPPNGEEALLDGVSLGFVGSDIPSRRLAAALERIPAGLLTKVVLREYSFDLTNDEVEIFSRALLSLTGLRSLEFMNYGDDDPSKLVTALKDLFHGRLHEFKLETTQLEADCLSALRSSDLQVFNLFVNQSKGGALTDVIQVIADAVPTMSSLEDLQVYFKWSSSYQSQIQAISSKQDHDNFVASFDAADPHLPAYVVRDALVKAVCRSPTIARCTLSQLSPWQQDQIAFAVKTRLIGAGELLSARTETTPLALFPLAFAKLSEGHWYDIMAYIVREKSDQLIDRFGVDTPGVATERQGGAVGWGWPSGYGFASSIRWLGRRCRSTPAAV